MGVDYRLINRWGEKIKMKCSRCENVMTIDWDQYKCIACGAVSYIDSELFNRTPTFTKSEQEEQEQYRKDREYYKKRDLVQAYVKKYGVGLTAKKLNMNHSSVGLLAKGISKKKFNRGKFPRELKLKATFHAIDINSAKRTAKDSSKLFGTKISRQALNNWIKEYEEHEGRGWD